MIISFGDPATEHLFHGISSKSSRSIPPDIQRSAIQKLDMINAAESIQDLRSPPSNHLEKLQGDLSGHYSIRINRQYRIVFQWTRQGAESVQIIDYHR